MRASTSASQACGSTSFILAVTIRLYITAVRCPPRSDPQNSHDRRPKGDAPQRAFGGVVRDASSAIVEKPGERRPTSQQVVDGAGDVVAAREHLALLAEPLVQFGDQRRRQGLPGLFGAPRQRGRSPMPRSMSNRASMRCTASRQIGDSTAGALPCAAPACAALDVCQHEELSPCVCPACGFQDRPRALRPGS